ncbi:hypothetical protein MNEG_1036 [Monoraphidium neglectum]|uniref:Uncharacterized protein n=1 Tax=Monoraphidium neglectum TaxID=145388 RepID=A0A0D2MWG5_9CHLO|nr:hypothetical protein MNEG_1036 [Monoraphidium neglectum]KIZ06910.1 hypothetical protein MNEG_1036 [Monoraphidium neglectum]|eukprot:XP_013905929.1 hypothetical protein MNEG_1036 [Monoraphidium neglectum]
MDAVEGAAVGAAREAMDRAYGPWTGPQWAPAHFSRAHSHKGRYLWTDAFGVCNYCSLYLETGDNRYLRQAETLAAAVHNTLGFTRNGASRLGNATDDHPTRGGLRIGKPNESGPDCDGQYLHYLNKWCFALLQATADEGRYLVWALELADATFDRFMCLEAPGGARRLAWKMTIDLSRPLVSSSGMLDALDSLVTFQLLEAAAGRALGDERGGAPRLDGQIVVAAALVAHWWRGFKSDDPLDLGEALWLAHWFASGDAGHPHTHTHTHAAAPECGGGGVLRGRGPGRELDLDLSSACDHVAARALEGLEGLWGEGYFSQPLSRRLGFRELGATLGVQVAKPSL